MPYAEASRQVQIVNQYRQRLCSFYEYIHSYSFANHNLLHIGCSYTELTFGVVDVYFVGAVYNVDDNLGLGIELTKVCNS